MAATLSPVTWKTYATCTSALAGIQPAIWPYLAQLAGCDNCVAGMLAVPRLAAEIRNLCTAGHVRSRMRWRGAVSALAARRSVPADCSAAGVEPSSCCSARACAHACCQRRSLCVPAVRTPIVVRRVAAAVAWLMSWHDIMHRLTDGRNCASRDRRCCQRYCPISRQLATTRALPLRSLSVQ
jgi:hypothetical protein